VEERKEIANRYIQKGMKATKAARLSGFSRSGYYYKPNGGKPGKKPTTTTLKDDGTVVKNTSVVNDIKDIISPEFIDYGYEKVTVELHKTGYVINRKKVYRLMKENNLLNPKRTTTKQLKNYVEYSQPYPSQPFEALEVDIKYIYIRGDNRNAYLITILDVLTRDALVWSLDYSMKSWQVIKLIDRLILNYLQPRDLLKKNIQVTIRNDNGSQFVAKIVREHLKNNQILQEFIKPATPKQNGYIESFHSTVEKLVCQKFEFESLAHARKVFNAFYETYNKKRILKCLLNKTPEEFLKDWENNKLVVSYDVITKKQKFFFREEQNLKPVLLPSRRNFFNGHSKDMMNKNNFYICKLIQS
jgi:transposase InsO family protein